MPDIELKPCPFCGSKAVFNLQRVLNDSPYAELVLVKSLILECFLMKKAKLNFIRMKGREQ